MKGQFFFLGAVVIVTGLIALKSLFLFYDIIEENRHLEYIAPDNTLWNIQREFSYSAGIGRMNNVRDDYLYDLSDNLRNDTKIKILYLLVTSNNTGFSVSTGNFLTVAMNGTLTNETAIIQFTSNDREKRRYHFASGTNITFAYTVLNKTLTEVVNFTGNMSKLFYDIEIFEQDYRVRVKETVVT